MACTTCFGASAKKLPDSRSSTGSNDIGAGHNGKPSNSQCANAEIVEEFPKDKLADDAGDECGMPGKVVENRGDTGELGSSVAGSNNRSISDASSVGSKRFESESRTTSSKVKASLADKPEAAAAMAAAKEATERGDMTGMCPPSRLGLFYEFFSLSHLTPPILCK
jgi:hypothetical protein